MVEKTRSERPAAFRSVRDEGVLKFRLAEYSKVSRVPRNDIRQRSNTVIELDSIARERSKTYVWGKLSGSVSK